jgi:hypothetical protein
MKNWQKIKQKFQGFCSRYDSGRSKHDLWMKDPKKINWFLSNITIIVTMNTAAGRRLLIEKKSKMWLSLIMRKRLIIAYLF